MRRATFQLCAESRGSLTPRRLRAALIAIPLVAVVACTAGPARDAGPRFATPEEAVQTLIGVARAGKLAEVVAIFGPEGREIISTSDEPTARKNLEVFATAAAEKWQLVNRGSDGKSLVIGHESWPFPVPLVKDASGWRFDTAAGKEEVLARRIGRNELAVIAICRTYVAAQRLYAARPHDGRPAGIYATAFRSDPGRENGLYWPAQPHEKRSPLGDLVAEAASDGQPLDKPRPPAPFHGYYFRILTEQGSAAADGAKNYLQDGVMTAGFALVAWPAQYDVTGVMTFIVNHDGIVHQRDLGPATDKTARTMVTYQPDSTWEAIP
jgi:hypothetical protein